MRFIHRHIILCFRVDVDVDVDVRGGWGEKQDEVGGG